MPLLINKREREGIRIYDLKGRLIAGEEAAAFRKILDELSLLKESKAILNLQEVAYIDSTGLGALVMAATELKKSAGTTKLLHVNRRNIELLVLTKIDTMFEVFDDEVEAVNSFFPGREIRKFDILSFVQSLKEE